MEFLKYIYNHFFNSLSGISSKSFSLGTITIEFVIFGRDVLAQFFMLILFLCWELCIWH